MVIFDNDDFGWCCLLTNRLAPNRSGRHRAGSDIKSIFWCNKPKVEVRMHPLDHSLCSWSPRTEWERPEICNLEVIFLCLANFENRRFSIIIIQFLWDLLGVDFRNFQICAQLMSRSSQHNHFKFLSELSETFPCAQKKHLWIATSEKQFFPLEKKHLFFETTL